MQVLPWAYGDRDGKKWGCAAPDRIENRYGLMLAPHVQEGILGYGFRSQSFLRQQTVASLSGSNANLRCSFNGRRLACRLGSAPVNGALDARFRRQIPSPRREENAVESEMGCADVSRFDFSWQISAVTPSEAKVLLLLTPARAKVGEGGSRTGIEFAVTVPEEGGLVKEGSTAL